MLSFIKRACALAAVLAATAWCSGAAHADTVLVTGANRGIGLEFVKQYAAKGYKVIATARRPDEAKDLHELAKANKSIVIEKLDVSDLASIDALAAKYKGQPVDILVNNAGITGFPDKQRFGSIDYESFDDVMNTNVRGPLKMSEAFTDNLAASKQKKIVVVTSSEGSIAGVTSNRQPFYRSSKAAVNMVFKNIAYPLKDKGIAVALINPGPVDTDMMASARGRMPLRTTELAVRELSAITEKLTLEQTATYFNFDGTTLPW
ncbi:MAG: SDR family oxidoreductase [Rhodospirillaceae bacterium]|nr:SDR family oxidoreductase [Rhodospirillaceae bacterium]